MTRKISANMVRVYRAEHEVSLQEAKRQLILELEREELLSLRNGASALEKVNWLLNRYEERFLDGHD